MHVLFIHELFLSVSLGWLLFDILMHTIFSSFPGAFGTAVLYRKKYDDSLVIVKEINMHDLTASERQLAINEVSFTDLKLRQSFEWNSFK